MKKLFKLFLIIIFTLAWEFYDYLFIDINLISSYGFTNWEWIMGSIFLILEKIFILYLFTWIYDYLKSSHYDDKKSENENA